MSQKLQTESEQPAKVYQLDAVDSKVSDLAAQMDKGFADVNSSLRTLILKSEGQVTPQQLVDNIAALKSNLESSLEEEVNKIHLTYGPLKENNKWLIRAIGGQAVIIVFQVVLLLYVTGVNK